MVGAFLLSFVWICLDVVTEGKVGKPFHGQRNWPFPNHRQGRLNAEELTLSNCDIGEDSGDLWTARRSKPVNSKGNQPWILLEGLCWSWSSNTLATWCEEPTHWKRLWCWKRLKAGEEGDDRGWEGWMASPSQWTWVWANSRRWWREIWRAAVHGITKSLTWLSDWIATIYQNNFAVHQKLTQHCKSTILH